MRKLKLGKKGLSPLVAVIVLLTLVMVLGAIIAGTLSGAPRPVLPATTAVNLTTEYGANPAAGDYILVIRHEYGSVIGDAVTIDNYAELGTVVDVVSGSPVFGTFQITDASDWNEMKLLINGEEAEVALLYLTSNGEVIVNCLTSDLNLNMNPDEWVWPATAEDAGAMDFAKGDMMVVALMNPELLEIYHNGPPDWPIQPWEPGMFLLYGLMNPDHPPTFTYLESSDLIQVVWEPRDLMLVEYLVQ